VAISNIERGQRGKNPPLETVVKLAQALGITVEALSTTMPPNTAAKKKKGT
jgi:transcriptional regulator with XRE-family HTH domain